MIDQKLVGFGEHGGCTSIHQGNKQWWIADLVEDSVIHKIRIMPRTDCCRDYPTVKVYTASRTHGNEWVLCRDLGNSLETSVAWVDVQCLDNRLRTRHIAVVQDANVALALCEVEVWGYTLIL